MLYSYYSTRHTPTLLTSVCVYVMSVSMSVCGPYRYQPSRLEDTTDPEVIISKAKLILNKLSVTNFDKLSDQFMTGKTSALPSSTFTLLRSPV